MENTSREEIHSTLQQFFNEYLALNSTTMDGFMDRFFCDDERVSVIGTGINEWCFGLPHIRQLFEDQLTREKKFYWGKLEMDLDTLIISQCENTVFFSMYTRVSASISQDCVSLNTLNSISQMINGDSEPKSKLMKANRIISQILWESSKGDMYKWPIRIMGVMTECSDIWKFMHIQFSFDSIGIPEYRIADVSYDADAVLRMANSVEKTEESEEIRRILQTFQDGYTLRDLDKVEEFMNSIFVMDGSQLVIGTDVDEWMMGQRCEDIIRSDWEYWGDVVLNVDDAVITVMNDVAWLSTKAIVKITITPQDLYDDAINQINEMYKSDDKPLAKLYNMQQLISRSLYEGEKGEQYIFPFRFSAIAVRKQEGWRFSMVQYSDPTDGIPEKRM